MASRSEQVALITLLRTGGRPLNAYADLLEDTGSASELLAQEQLLGPEGADELDEWEAQGITLVSILDPRYPENLKAVHDRPALIFLAGELRAEDARSLAVIGSRKATPAGIATARSVAEHLVTEGFTVTSGLAAGIDTAAHTAALERGGRTIAVIGTGLHHAYPPQNAQLQRRIAAECAVVSQFWPDDGPTRRSFPVRNAVMSGISLGTVIVEASATSGARVQSRLALAQGRPVFLLDALLEQEWARELASRPGVHVVGEPQQITATVERLTATDSPVG